MTSEEFQNLADEHVDKMIEDMQITWDEGFEELCLDCDFKYSKEFTSTSNQ